MKTLVSLVSFLLLLLVVSSNANAQGMPDIPESNNNRYEKTAEETHNERIRPKELPGRTYPITREPQVLKNGILAPSEEDRIAHSEFLKQSKTGLIRLMPREIYDWQTYNTPKQVSIRGGGAYFSFFHRAHEYGYGSDLELDQNKLSVGFAGAQYGMIADLGDVPIDSIAEDDARLVFMSNYEPRTLESEARDEYRRFSAGVTIDDFTYRRRTPARSQNTYLLRSIDFRRSDLLVAFRVTRIDTDGSAIIAWKLLKTFPTPQLKQ